ncbi:barttin isoform X1 [Cuculus canorus]|uniref:barttin isoform X1 n=1 Tax=Cuculus canorus TaxID=55661 RepID=UPI0023AB531A|nr:barttin isoform X1 [Cuculus canorus]
MAEEKNFRYGFIMLGFFLVMTGMFIMSVEKPHIYITFCTLGILLVAVGITWSMCQCYPKITFVPVDPEAERFLDHKPIVLPEKDTRLQPPCPNQEATNTYEKSLPSYEQIQIQAAGSAPLRPTTQLRPRSCSQPAVQAKAEVHWELEGVGEPPREPTPQLEMAAGTWHSMQGQLLLCPIGTKENLAAPHGQRWGTRHWHPSWRTWTHHRWRAPCLAALCHKADPHLSLPPTPVKPQPAPQLEKSTVVPPAKAVGKRMTSIMGSKRGWMLCLRKVTAFLSLKTDFLERMST